MIRSIRQLTCAYTFATVLLLAGPFSHADTIFLEAEKAFTPSSDGWKINDNQQARGASALKALNGAGGEKPSSAEARFSIKDAGNYRIWVRHNYHSTRRGPFTLDLIHGVRSLGKKTFDLETRDGVKNWLYVWDYLDVSLKPGEHRLTLTKHENQNCTSYVRNVDCVLITTDKKREPNHLEFGPQTWVRVTVGDVYEKPVQLHIFADHYRAPWYGRRMKVLHHLCKGHHGIVDLNEVVALVADIP